ncbi:MAG: hypothetical protein M1822_006085 [Bathelium mastoideum]|nr:MAG: hypothetical protein M1822_006085 [Bathelium mastoideum]
MRPSRQDAEYGDTDLDGRYRDDPNEERDEGAALLGDADDGTFSIHTEEDHDNTIATKLRSRWNRFVEKRVPVRVRRTSRIVVKWVKGPQPPYIYRIDPIFPSVQTAPTRLLDRLLPKRRHKAAALLFFYFLWLLTFSLVLRKSAFATEIEGHGVPVTISDNGNGCGLNGDNCRPFGNSTLAFRCPANCKRVEIVNPHAVGDQEVNYRPLVIGGPSDPDEPVSSSKYRGDSFICGSAIHAGFISNREGGCGVLSLIGEHKEYPATKQHGISSISFDSWFPLSFSFLDGTATQCKDLRWPLLAVSVIFTTLLSLFTTSPAVFFWTLFTGMFFHVALASDPPSLSNYYDLISSALGRFLPAAFCGAVVYRYCVRRSLTDLTAQIEKTILWLGACWVGALNNYTFDRIPIQRLTPHDIKQQPGAIPALVIIVLSIFFIALGQAWSFRQEGRMPRYLALYVFMGVCLIIMVLIPRMSLRIHHYILALLLLPGTSFQNRQSLLYQGLLVGLFINGIARWGFDSILQTPAELRGDAQLGTRLPHLNAPIIPQDRANITFTWPNVPSGYDGMSVLVNDVERWRVYQDERQRWDDGFTWSKRDDVNEYFRFAYMRGSGAVDYTKAGVWTRDGEWEAMDPGPSLADAEDGGEKQDGVTEDDMYDVEGGEADIFDAHTEEATGSALPTFAIDR